MAKQSKPAKKKVIKVTRRRKPVADSQGRLAILDTIIKAAGTDDFDREAEEILAQVKIRKK